jgi:nitrate/nitrite transporter NarK
MTTALAASALLLGALAERPRRAGIPTELFLAGTLALSMTAQLALLLGLPVSSYLLFSIVAVAGATTALSFAALAQYFPKEVSGRANAALGVLNMGTAFGPHCLSGFMAHAVARALGFGRAPLPIVRPVYASWTYQAELARRQRAAWAFAAAASAALCMGLAATLLITISRPVVAFHVIDLSRPSGLPN